MDVSIIIVNYNTKDLLMQCLDSIISYTKEIEYEIIVSDNGSKDGSIEIIKQKYPKVILIENNANIGFGAANNKGLNIATGKYIFYLNSDTYLINNAVKYFFDYWEENGDKESLGAIGGVLLDSSLQSIHSGANLPDYKSYCKLQRLFIKFHIIKTIVYIFGLGKLYLNYQKKKSIKENVSVGEIGYVTGADLFMKNDQYAKFDEQFFMYSEETDMQKRLSDNGKKRMIIEGPKIVHLTKKIPQKFEIESLSVFFMQESFLLYAKKHFDKIAYLKFLIYIDRLNPFLWKKIKKAKEIYYERNKNHK